MYTSAGLSSGRRLDAPVSEYRVRGWLLKSGMTENAVYGQTLMNMFGSIVMTKMSVLFRGYVAGHQILNLNPLTGHQTGLLTDKSKTIFVFLACLIQFDKVFHPV
jgi:hypothetical protein